MGMIVILNKKILQKLDHGKEALYEGFFAAKKAA
jgi:hypothetical protein